MKIADTAWGQAQKEKAQELARKNAVALRKMHEAAYTTPREATNLLIVSIKVQCESQCSFCNLTKCQWEA